MGAGSVPAEVSAGLCTRFRVLSFQEKPLIFQEQSEVRGRVTCVFTWRILLFVFCFGLLAVPPEDINLEDAPPFL